MGITKSVGHFFGDLGRPAVNMLEYSEREAKGKLSGLMMAGIFGGLIYGTAKTHPLQGLGTTVQQTLFNDPNAIAKIAGAGIQNQINNWTGGTPFSDIPTPTYADNPYQTPFFQRTSTAPAVDGSIVFGMRNLRHGGA